MKPTTYKSQKSIAEALRTIPLDQHVSVTFAPIADPVWLQAHDDGATVFCDATRFAIDPDFIADIAIGHEVEFMVRDRNSDGNIVRIVDDSGSWLEVTAKHLRTLTVLPSPVKFRPDGMTMDVEFHPDGRVSAGCQTLTPAGALDLFHRLGEALGYEIMD